MPFVGKGLDPFRNKNQSTSLETEGDYDRVHYGKNGFAGIRGVRSAHGDPRFNNAPPLEGELKEMRECPINKTPSIPGGAQEHQGGRIEPPEFLVYMS